MGSFSLGSYLLDEVSDGNSHFHEVDEAFSGLGNVTVIRDETSTHHHELQQSGTGTTGTYTLTESGTSTYTLVFITIGSPSPPTSGLPFGNCAPADLVLR